VLVGYDSDGEARLLESYSLAETELGFWTLATMPRKAAHEHGARLSEFLRRCLLRQAPIATPQELAWFLASYAREARARAEEHDLPALATTRAALEEALGMGLSGSSTARPTRTATATPSLSTVNRPSSSRCRRP